MLGNAAYSTRIKSSSECRLLLDIILQMGLICIHNITAVLVLGDIYNKSIFFVTEVFGGILISAVSVVPCLPRDKLR